MKEDSFCNNLMFIETKVYQNFIYNFYSTYSLLKLCAGNYGIYSYNLFDNCYCYYVFEPNKEFLLYKLKKELFNIILIKKKIILKDEDIFIK